MSIIAKQTYALQILDSVSCMVKSASAGIADASLHPKLKQSQTLKRCRKPFDRLSKLELKSSHREAFGAGAGLLDLSLQHWSEKHSIGTTHCRERQ